MRKFIFLAISAIMWIEITQIDGKFFSALFLVWFIQKFKINRWDIVFFGKWLNINSRMEKVFDEGMRS